MWNEILLSVRNVRRRRLSFFLSVLSVAIGLSSVIMIASVGKSGKDTVLNCVKGVGMEGLMFTHAASYFDGDGFDQVIADEVRTQSDGRIRSMPFSLNYAKASFIDSDTDIVLWGIGYRSEQYILSNLLFGRMPNDAEIENAERVIVISEDVALTALGRRNAVGQFLSLVTEGKREDYRVIGVIQAETDSISLFYRGIPAFVYAPYTSLKRYNGLAVSRLIARSDVLSEDTVRDTVRSVVTQRRGEAFSYEVTNFDEGSAGTARVADVLTDVLTFSSSVSLAVAGSGIMSAQLGSVSARKEEIGVLKAVGATDGQVAFCFLTESFLIAVTGVFSGLLTSISLLAVLFRLLRLPFTLNEGVILPASLLSAATGLLFGALPAVRAAKADPIDALRSR